MNNCPGKRSCSPLRSQTFLGVCFISLVLFGCNETGPKKRKAHSQKRASSRPKTSKTPFFLAHALLGTHLNSTCRKTLHTKHYLPALAIIVTSSSSITVVPLQPFLSIDRPIKSPSTKRGWPSTVLVESINCFFVQTLAGELWAAGTGRQNHTWLVSLFNCCSLRMPRKPSSIPTWNKTEKVAYKTRHRNLCVCVN